MRFSSSIPRHSMRLRSCLRQGLIAASSDVDSDNHLIVNPFPIVHFTRIGKGSLESVLDSTFINHPSRMNTLRNHKGFTLANSKRIIRRAQKARITRVRRTSPKVVAPLDKPCPRYAPEEVIEFNDSVTYQPPRPRKTVKKIALQAPKATTAIDLTVRKEQPIIVNGRTLVTQARHIRLRTRLGQFLVPNQCSIYELPPCPDSQHSTHVCPHEGLFWLRYAPLESRQYLAHFSSTIARARELLDDYRMDAKSLQEFLCTGIVALMVTCHDEYIFPVEGFKDEFSTLYDLRRLCGMNGDFGLRRFGYEIKDHISEFSDCEQNTHKLCSCYRTYMQRAHCDSCYQKWSESLLIAVATVPISFGQARMMHKEKDQIAKARRSSIYRQLQFVQNDEYAVLPFRSIYRTNNEDVSFIRKKVLGLAKDFGCFFPQTQGLTLSTWITNAADRIAIELTGTYIGIKSYVEAVIEKIKTMTSVLFGSLSEMINETILRRFDNMFSFMRNVFSDVAEFTKEQVADIHKIIRLVAAVLMLASLSVCGLVAFNTIFGSQPRTQANSLYGTLITIICFIFGYKANCLGSLSTLCRNLSVIAAGSAVTIGIGGAVFGLLPVIVRHAFVQKFGTADAKATINFDYWKIMGLTILSASKVAPIVASPNYHEKISEFLNRGGRIIKDLSEPRLRSEAINLFFRVVSLSSTIVQFQRTRGSRPLPFGLHLAGRPGIGKTILFKRLLENVWPEYSNSTYTKPVSTEYWDGFVSADAIIWDEHLVNQDTATKQGAEYLGLMSTAMFIPDMASTDNITVGLKGTPCAPSVVITANNRTHYAPSGIDAQAYYRRRNVVVHMVNDHDWYNKNDWQTRVGNLNLLKMTSEDLRYMKWISFLIKDPVNESAPALRLDYNEFIQYLKLRYDEHKQLCQLMQADERPVMDPVAEFDKISAEFYGIPTRPITITEAIKSVFGLPSEVSDDPVVQGAKEEDGSDDDDIPENVPEFPPPPTSEDTYWSTSYRTPSETSETDQPPPEPSKPTTARQKAEPWVYQKADTVPSEAPPVDENFHKFGFAADFIVRSAEVPLSFRGTQAITIPLPKSEYDAFWNQIPDNRWKSFLNVTYPVEVETLTLYAMNKRASIEQCHMFLVNPGSLTSWILLGIESEEGCENIYYPLQKEIDNSAPCLEYMQEVYDAWAERNNQPKAIVLAACYTYRGIKLNVRVNNDETEIEIPLTSSPEFTNFMTFVAPREDTLKNVLSFPFRELCRIRAWQTTSKVSQFMDEPVDELQELVTPKTQFSDYTYATIISISLLFLGYCAVRRFHNKADVPEMVCWVQSHKPHKTSRAQRRERTIRPMSHGGTQGALAKPYTIDVHGNVMYCMPVSGRLIMCPFHAFEDVATLKTFRVALTSPGGARFEFTMGQEEVMSIEGHDVAFFKVPLPSFPAMKDLSAKFLPEEDISRINQIECSLMIKDPIIVTAQVQENVRYFGHTTDIILDRAFVYRAITEIGYCGAPLVSSGQTYPGHILGFHVAGTQERERIGISDIISREDVRAIIDYFNQLPPSLEMTTQGCRVSIPEEEHVARTHNIVRHQQVPKVEQTFNPTSTKLKPSFLHGHLLVKSVKQPAILTDTDPRLPMGVTVMENLYTRWNMHNNANIDSGLLTEITSTMFTNYKRDMDRTFRLRRLSIEEAIKGIPGYLSSLKISTSPGWPMIKLSDQSGKRSCFAFDENGGVTINPDFERRVNQRLLEMAGFDDPHSTFYTGNSIDNRFLVYLKDELVSPEKIHEGRTRAIYCNDVVSLVAFRVVYGSLLATLNQSYANTPLAISLNQFSYDMDTVYGYLAKNSRQFVAGDYKNFDCTYHRSIQRAAYNLFFRLNADEDGPLSTDSEDKYLYSHETKNLKLQFRDTLYTLDTFHTSGCFLTTIINCFVNEIYMRYAFVKLNPSLEYDRYVRGKFLGDDHILSVAKNCTFNPLDIKRQLSEMGLTYTSDDKNAELTADFRTFDQVTFLGAHPRQIKGRWTGACKKSILWQMVQWTRTNNQDLIQNCETAVYLASQWDEEFFNTFRSNVLSKLSAYRLYQDFLPSYEEMQRIAASRTAASGLDFFVVQGDSSKHEDALKGAKKITQIQDMSIKKPENYLKPRPVVLRKGLQEAMGTLDIGTDSSVFRTQVTWSTTNNAGANLLALNIPQNILSLGNRNNQQNMPFERFIYGKFDIEITLQVAGTRFQQGALIAYISPLSVISSPNHAEPHYTTGLTTFFASKILSPNTNTTSVIHYGYHWYRNWLNTYAISQGTENMCKLVIKVLEPLTVASGSTSATVTIFSRFKNADWALPRPVLSPAAYATEDALQEGNLLRIQGGVNSTVVKNEYYIQHVVGNVPIGTTTNNTNKQDGELSLPMPLDNPPCLSGSMPFYTAYPSRSKTLGFHTAVKLGHAPEEMHREPFMFAMGGDTSIEKYCGVQTLWRKFTWQTNQSADTTLANFPLNSTLGANPYQFGRVSDPDTYMDLPACMIPLNMAAYWRADFQFTFMPVMTDYHSGKLRVSIAFGSPGYAPDEAIVFKNQILDFTSGISLATVTVPYNAATEYLSSNRGEIVHKLQDCSLGTLAVSIANALTAPDQVPQTVSVYIGVSLTNVKLREVLPYNVINPARYLAQGGEGDNELVADDFEDPMPVEITESSPEQPEAPCKLEIGNKFEYTWTDFMEVARRFCEVSTDLYTIDTIESRTIRINCRPPPMWSCLFAAWAGHQSYRIKVVTDVPSFVTVKFNADGGMQTILGTTYLDNVSNMGGDLNFTPSGGTASKVGQYPSGSLLNPSEDLFPLPSNVHYVDVVVPFNSIYNYLPTLRDPENFINSSVGALLVEASPGAKIVRFQLLWKATDDFRFLLPLPYSGMRPLAVPDLAVVPDNRVVAGFFTPLT